MLVGHPGCQGAPQKVTETVDGAGGDGKNVTKKKDRKPGLDSKAEGGM